MYVHAWYNMYVHVWSILLQYVHTWSVLLQYVCTGMVNTAVQYVCTGMVNTAVQYACTGMVNTAVQYVYAWYISKITRECPTNSLLTTHAHYISDGFVGAYKGRTTWGTVILHNFV